MWNDEPTIPSRSSSKKWDHDLKHDLKHDLIPSCPPSSPHASDSTESSSDGDYCCTTGIRSTSAPPGYDHYDDYVTSVAILTPTASSYSSASCQCTSSFTPGSEEYHGTNLNSSKKCTHTMGRDAQNYSITGSLRRKEELDATGSACCIGIEGTYYDVSKYVPHHPGGDVITEFHDKDATAQFLAYHPKSVFKQLKSFKKKLQKKDKEANSTKNKYNEDHQYEFDHDKPFGSKLQGEWMKLNEKFEKERRYETPMSFFLQKAVLVLMFASISLWNAYMYKHYDDSGSSSNISHSNNDDPSMATQHVSVMQHVHVLFFIISAMFFAGVLQQAGFIVHDAMHNHITHNRHIDQRIGFFFSTIIFGLSSQGWKNEHNEHHLYTNTHVKEIGPSDPQMFENVWIQHEDLIPYFVPLVGERVVRNIILKYQKYYFIPLCIFVSPIAMRIVSVVRNRRNDEFMGIMSHVTCMCLIMFRSFDTVMEGMLFVYLTYTFVGVLSLQLLISHYSKPFVDKNEIINQEDKPRAMFRTTATSTCCWAYHQIQSVTDIKCPAYMDWFHGGLNMHSIHHLFPRMSRYHYRAVYNDVLELGKRNGVPIDQQCFSEALMNVTHQLGKVGKKSL